MYDRDYLQEAIPRASVNDVADGGFAGEADRQAFADGYNVVLDALRAGYLPGADELTEDQVNYAVQLASDAWCKYCEQQGDVERTLAWLRAELA